MDSRAVIELYESLPLSDSDIRILVLQPAPTTSQPLSTTLIVEKLPVKVASLDSVDPEHSWQALDEDLNIYSSRDGRFYRIDTQCCYSASNRYEALSYVWGELDTPCNIIVNNLSIPIGRNLDILLRQIRSQKETVLLWVDALCINQLDDLEKTFQVSNMSEIYRRAWQVTIWLGEESACEDGRLALAFWAWLGSRDVEKFKYFPISAAVKQAKGDIEFPKDEFLAPGHSLKRPEAHNLSETDQKRLTEDHIRSFFQRSWFSRRWILQEFAVARNKTIRVGNYSMKWEQAHMIAANRTVLGESASIVARESRLGLSVLRMIEDVGPDSAENLWFELGYFDGSGCYDDRDRLAAFQWRIDQAMTHFTRFRTDYSISAEENYKAFAVAIVQCSCDMFKDSKGGGPSLSVKMNLLEGLLVTAAIRRPAQQSSALPTWVPDWRIVPRGRWRWAYGHVPLSPPARPPEQDSNLELWQRRIRIVAWVAKDDSVHICSDCALQIQTYELATLDISTGDCFVRDNDIVLLNIFESDPILGFRHDHDRESILLRATDGGSTTFQIVAANPNLMVERDGALRSAWEVDKSSSGGSCSQIWADFSRYGNVQSHEAEIIPHIGIPSRKFIYYKPLKEMSYLIIE